MKTLENLFDTDSEKAYEFREGDSIFEGGTISKIHKNGVFVKGNVINIKNKDMNIFSALKENKYELIFYCDVVFMIENYFNFYNVPMYMRNDCDMEFMNISKESTIKNLKLKSNMLYDCDEIIFSKKYFSQKFILEDCDIHHYKIRTYDELPILKRSKIGCMELVLEFQRLDNPWKKGVLKDDEEYNKIFEKSGLYQKSFDTVSVYVNAYKNGWVEYQKDNHNNKYPIHYHYIGKT